MDDIYRESLELHWRKRGKLEVRGKVPVRTRRDLSLAFPGIFRGALDARATKITDEMKVAAAHALAGMVKKPTRNRILPGPLNPKVAGTVAAAVAEAARVCGCAREIAGGD